MKFWSNIGYVPMVFLHVTRLTIFKFKKYLSHAITQTNFSCFYFHKKSAFLLHIKSQLDLDTCL